MRRTLTTLALVGLLVPTIALAQTADLQAYIQSLYQQIQALQLKIAQMQGGGTVATTPVASARVCPNISRTMWLGSVNRSETNTDVSDLQKFLTAEGFYFGETYGMFDAATQLAVQEFQQEENLVTSGTYRTTGFGAVGPRTRAAIARRCANQYPNPTGCTQQYQPVCAAKQVQCITTPCNPVPTTYGNKCEATRDSAAYLYEGVCRDQSQCPAYNIPQCGTNGRILDQGYDSVGCKKAPICSYDDVNPSANSQCKAWFDGCNTCGRSTPGGPAFCTLKACSALSMAPAYCSAYFDATPSTAPSISNFSGPATLNVNQSGTWSISITSPQNNGQVSYSIIWGDEAYSPAYGLSASSQSIPQNSTFTHAYANPGTYTVRITVRNSLGSAEATASVVVKNNASICTMEYAPVCGQPLMPYCPPGMACAQVMPNPQTYSNRCMMNGAGASFLYSGQCQSTGTTACTMDARQCPDGSYVGRTGPYCQFVCPSGVVY